MVELLPYNWQWAGICELYRNIRCTSSPLLSRPGLTMAQQLLFQDGCAPASCAATSGTLQGCPHLS